VRLCNLLPSVLGLFFFRLVSYPFGDVIAACCSERYCLAYLALRVLFASDEFDSWQSVLGFIQPCLDGGTTQLKQTLGSLECIYVVNERTRIKHVKKRTG